jgi:hypothetical protein
MGYCAGILLAVAGGALFWAPGPAPAAIAAALATASWPIARAWRGARGTALRSAVIWGAVAVALGIVSQVLGATEPLGSGRPGAGHLTYLSVLATLAALTSVLNARTPGGGAWALLMGLLVLVLLIPWLEAPGLVRNTSGLARLRLEAPWSLFYALVAVAGVTNYLPTRYGPAAACLGAMFVLEYLALARSDWTAARRGILWSVPPWILALAAWVAEARSRWPARDLAGTALETAWRWFRDHWGMVWALRVQERFNRAAAAAGWPSRLSWYGLVPAAPAGGGSDQVEATGLPAAAESTLAGLLRRFATAQRIAAESARHGTGPDLASAAGAGDDTR